MAHFFISRRELTHALLSVGLSLTSFYSLAQSNRIDQIRSDAPALAAYGPFDIGVQTLQLKNPGQWDMVNAKPGQAKKSLCMTGP